MKKIPAYEFKSVPPVVLYQEDLKAIENLLSAEFGGVVIDADGYSYESIAELVKHRPSTRIKKLFIRSAHHECTARFSPYLAEISFSAGTMHEIGVGHSFEELIKAGRRRLSFAYNSLFCNILCLLPIFIFGAQTEKQPTSQILVLTAIVGIAWWSWAYFINFHQHGIVLTDNRALSPSFWARNRDALGVNIFAAVAASLATLILSK